MKTSPYITLLLVIFLLSGASAFLLFSYMDPERNLPIAYTTMGIAGTLFIASFLSVFIYFLKKIYYRGIVSPKTLHSSIRQSFFLAIVSVGLVAFYKFGVLTLKTGGLLLFIFMLFELMIQSIVEED